MTKTLSFNTGRKYTSAGQRIVATLYEDTQTVTFMDHDRGVDGEFKLAGDFTIAAIMNAYDNYIARSTAQSFADGMREDGCNSKKGA
jgi:hypothetical protein